MSYHNKIVEVINWVPYRNKICENDSNFLENNSQIILKEDKEDYVFGGVYVIWNLSTIVSDFTLNESDVKKKKKEGNMLFFLI